MTSTKREKKSTTNLTVSNDEREEREKKEISSTKHEIYFTHIGFV